MRNTPSRKSPMWALRHRRQHAAFKAGKTLPVDPKTSKRFGVEFEQAVRQRGEIAKAFAVGAGLLNNAVEECI